MDGKLNKTEHNGTQKGISSRQMKILALLGNGMNVADACKAAHVGRTTFYVWLKNDIAFQNALSKQSYDQLQLLASRLLGLSQLAIDVLQNTMGNSAAPSRQLRSAEIVLARAETMVARLQSLREMNDMTARLDHIEQLLEGQENAH